MADDARDRETRKADTLAMLATQAIDVWGRIPGDSKVDRRNAG
jgi:hypothetical protein